MKVCGKTSTCFHALGPEEAGFGHAELGVARGIETVTKLARDCTLLADPVEIEIVPRLLVGRERVVEVADRVRRVRDLQDEVGERLHVGVRERRAASEQVGEAPLELLERRVLVERAAVRLRARRVVAAGAIAAPVHRAVVGHAAQALRGHRALHRLEDRVGDRISA